MPVKDHVRLEDIYRERVVSKVQPGEWEFPVQQIGEFTTTRPTPTQAENDQLGATAGAIFMNKWWDLSPVDPTSFDPTEPPGRPVPPPTNTAPPIITALTDLNVGSQLVNNSQGTWTGSPTLARQWRRSGAIIAGQTGATYTLVAADVGATIRCDVTATNAGGSVTTPSNSLGPILPALPTNTTPPVVTGSTVVAGLLSTTNGAWTGAPTSYDYIWTRNGTGIGGAVNQTYTTGGADVGAMIACSVRAANAGGQTAQLSNAVGPITTTAADPEDEPVPQPTRPQPRRR